MQQMLPESINRSKNLYLYGSNDALVRKESVLAMSHLFNENTSFMEFNGKHEVNESCVNQIKTWLDQV
jgi:hypothetical protein